MGREISDLLANNSMGADLRLIAGAPESAAAHGEILSEAAEGPTLLARLGEDAPVQLEQIETRIERHLATLVQNGSLGVMPSLRLLQAPVFHGYSFSIWAEFEGEAPDPRELESLLGEDDDIDVHAGS